MSVSEADDLLKVSAERERLAKAFSEQGNLKRASSLRAQGAAARAPVDAARGVVADLEREYSSDALVSYNSFLDRRSNEKTVEEFDPTVVVKNPDGTVTFNRYQPYNYSEGKNKVYRKPALIQSKTLDRLGNLVSAKGWTLGSVNKYGEQTPILSYEETPLVKRTARITKDDDSSRVREWTVVDKLSGVQSKDVVYRPDPRVPKYDERVLTPSGYVGGGAYSGSSGYDREEAVAQRERFVASGESKQASAAEVSAAQKALVSRGDSVLSDDVSGRPIGVVGSLAFAVREKSSEPRAPSVLEEGVVLSRSNQKRSVLVFEGSGPRDASEAFARLGYPERELVGDITFGRAPDFSVVNQGRKLLGLSVNEDDVPSRRSLIYSQTLTARTEAEARLAGLPSVGSFNLLSEEREGFPRKSFIELNAPVLARGLEVVQEKERDVNKAAIAFSEEPLLAPPVNGFGAESRLAVRAVRAFGKELERGAVEGRAFIGAGPLGSAQSIISGVAEEYGRRLYEKPVSAGVGEAVLLGAGFGLASKGVKVVKASRFAAEEAGLIGRFVRGGVRAAEGVELVAGVGLTGAFAAQTGSALLAAPSAVAQGGVLASSSLELAGFVAGAGLGSGRLLSGVDTKPTIKDSFALNRVNKRLSGQLLAPEIERIVVGERLSVEGLRQKSILEGELFSEREALSGLRVQKSFLNSELAIRERVLQDVSLQKGDVKPVVEVFSLPEGEFSGSFVRPKSSGDAILLRAIKEAGTRLRNVREVPGSTRSKLRSVYRANQSRIVLEREKIPEINKLIGESELRIGQIQDKFSSLDKEPIFDFRFKDRSLDLLQRSLSLRVKVRPVLARASLVESFEGAGVRKAESFFGEFLGVRRELSSEDLSSLSDTFRVKRSSIEQVREGAARERVSSELAPIDSVRRFEVRSSQDLGVRTLKDIFSGSGERLKGLSSPDAAEFVQEGTSFIKYSPSDYSGLRVGRLLNVDTFEPVELSGSRSLVKTQGRGSGSGSGSVYSAFEFPNLLRIDGSPRLGLEVLDAFRENRGDFFSLDSSSGEFSLSRRFEQRSFQRGFSVNRRTVESGVLPAAADVNKNLPRELARAFASSEKGSSFLASQGVFRIERLEPKSKKSPELKGAEKGESSDEVSVDVGGGQKLVQKRAFSSSGLQEAVQESVQQQRSESVLERPVSVTREEPLLARQKNRVFSRFDALGQGLRDAFYNQKFRDSLRSGPRVDLRGSARFGVLSGQDERSRVDQRLGQNQLFSQSQGVGDVQNINSRLDARLDSRARLDVRQEPRVVPKIKFDYGLSERVRSLEDLVPEPIVPPVGGLRLSRESLSPAGFQVLVKRRGEFVKASNRVLSREAALVLGASIADSSPAQQFRIVESSSPAERGVEPSPLRLRSLLSKFTSKGGGLFKEKQSSLIDSAGEVRDISLKGVRASAQSRKQLRRFGL